MYTPIATTSSDAITLRFDEESTSLGCHQVIRLVQLYNIVSMTLRAAILTIIMEQVQKK